MIKAFILAGTHLATLAAGFALGIYLLPILTAPPAPTTTEIRSAMDGADFRGKFDRNLPGSDFLHWGEGEVVVGKSRIVHQGRLAPGPDYKVYLAKSFVDTKQGFLAIKQQSVRLGDVKTFNGFIVDVPSGVDVTAYTTVVVWCEAFSQFISAAKYR
jgi:hypothetical protein